MLKILSLLLVLVTLTFAAGQSALVYMEIPVGSRQTALGESFVSVADDPFTLMFNPAGLGMYPLNNALDDITLDSMNLIDAVFKYENNPEILMLLTKNGLSEYNNGRIKEYATVLLSPDETVEEAVKKWITDKSKFDQYLAEVIKLNNLNDIDYEETFSYELMLPYNIITDEKIKNLKKAPDGTLFLICDTSIIVQSDNGWKKLGHEQGLRGKIKNIDFVGNSLWVMTNKALFSIENYDLIDQTTFFNPITSNSLRTFWNKFNGFKFIRDSTIWFKSKEYGILEYNLKNINRVDSIKYKKMKKYNIGYLNYDSLSTTNYTIKNYKNNSIFTLDSTILNLLNKSDTLKDSIVQNDSISIDSLILEKIKSTKFDSIFTNLTDAKAFIDTKDSLYALKLSKFKKNIYAKDFLSYNKVIKKNEVSDIITLDSLVMVLSEGGYYIKKDTKWSRFKMPNLKRGKFIGSNSNEVFIQTSGELLKYNFKKNIWTVEIQKKAIAGAYSEKGFFLVSNNNISIYKKTGISFGFDYQNILPELDSKGEMFIVSIPVIIPNIPIGALGISLNYASYGTMEATDEEGNITSTIHPMDLNMGIHWGTQITKHSSIGIGFKGYYSKLASGISVGTQGSKPAMGWLADIGYLQKTPIINFGASIMNLGPKIVYVDDNQADNAPSVASLGVSKTIKSDNFSIMPSIDFSRNIWEGVNTIATDTSKNLDNTNSNDSRFVKELKAISPHGGIEFIYANLLSLRVGYLYDAIGNRNYMPLGGGFKIHDISIFKELNLDFAYIVPGFGAGEKSVNEGTFKITIGSKLK